MILKLKSGFSLIELMVVIAIVAILSSVSVPAYKNYLYRSQMSNVVNMMHGILNQGRVIYASTGVIPSTIGSYPSGTAVNFTGSDLVQCIRYYPGSALGRPTSMLIQAGVSSKIGDLLTNASPTYSTPAPSGICTGGGAGTAAWVSLAIYQDSNGNIQTICGAWDGSNMHIKPADLPSFCNANTVGSILPIS